MDIKEYDIIYFNMIEGIIFDFDNTLYDYDLCNKKSLETIIDYISINFNYDKEIVYSTYKQINQHIKCSNNHSNKFNKYIYFKQLLESLKIKISNLDNIIKLFENEFNKNMILFTGVNEIFKFFT